MLKSQKGNPSDEIFPIMTPERFVHCSPVINHVTLSGFISNQIHFPTYMMSRSASNHTAFYMKEPHRVLCDLASWKMSRGVNSPSHCTSMMDVINVWWGTHMYTHTHTHNTTPVWPYTHLHTQFMFTSHAGPLVYLKFHVEPFGDTQWLLPWTMLSQSQMKRSRTWTQHACPGALFAAVFRDTTR